MKTALIIGSTGLIGSQLLDLLLKSPEYDKVITFVKRDSGIHHPKLKQHIIDFDRPESYKDLVVGDDFYYYYRLGQNVNGYHDTSTESAETYNNKNSYKSTEGFDNLFKSKKKSLPGARFPGYFCCCCCCYYYHHLFIY